MQNYRPIPYIQESPDGWVAVLGSPIIGNAISAQECARLFLATKDFCATAKSINGEFLVVHYSKDREALTIVNDRFASIPWYFALSGDAFFGSVYYSDLWTWLSKRNALDPRGEVMFEFIAFQHVLGTQTYDRCSEFLKAASVLSVTKRSVTRRDYWQPSFDKRAVTLQQSAGEFIDLLDQAIRRKRGSSERCGLLLSGGMDTRVLMAAFKTPLHCFTVGFHENNEVAVARAIARLRDFPHHFVAVGDDYFSRAYEPVSRLVGAMNVYDHALFWDLGAAVQPHADVLFHGHGLDYMFQGMYLPAYKPKALGHQTFLKWPRRLVGNVASAYRNTIHYRLKHIDLLQYVKAAERSRIDDFLTESIESVLREGRAFCQTSEDLWEYLITHNLSRHYSNANIATIVRYAQQRTIAFDNDLFDFYHALPQQHRFAGRMIRRALHSMNPSLAAYPSANHGLRIDYGPWQLESAHLWRHLKFLTTRDARHRHPDASQRTWPYRTDYLPKQPQLLKEIKEAVESERIYDAMPFLDADRLRTDTEVWLRAGKGSADFMASLLTLHVFLKQR